MFEVLEVSEYDGCVEVLAVLRTCSDLQSAVATAVNCRRPGIEVRMPNGWLLSHRCNADGSWAQTAVHSKKKREFS